MRQPQSQFIKLVQIVNIINQAQSQQASKINQFWSFLAKKEQLLSELWVLLTC